MLTKDDATTGWLYQPPIPDHCQQLVPAEWLSLGWRVKTAVVTKWRTVTIEEVAEKVAIGPFGSSIKVETFRPEGVPIIRGQHLRGSRTDDTPGHNFISHDHADRLANATVQRGDVVFTHAGNIGQVACIPPESKPESTEGM